MLREISHIDVFQFMLLTPYITIHFINYALKICLNLCWIYYEFKSSFVYSISNNLNLDWLYKLFWILSTHMIIEFDAPAHICLFQWIQIECLVCVNNWTNKISFGRSFPYRDEPIMPNLLPDLTYQQIFSYQTPSEEKRHLKVKC